MGRTTGPGRKKLGPRQLLARRKTLDYVERLGLRKAATRLETRVSDLRRWLASSFPSNKLDAAIGLGKPGGSFVYIRGTKLGALIKEKGARAVSALTGIPGKELVAIVRRRANSAVKIKRDTLEKLTKKKGAEKLAATLGTKVKNVTEARRLPLTEATIRLKKFVEIYGPQASSSFLGITTRQLSGWLKKGIPRSWEPDIAQIVGKRSIPDDSQVKKKRASIARAIAIARRRVIAWNKKVASRFRIRLSDAERWARLGNFETRFQAAQEALQAAKKPGKPQQPKPAPIQAPSRPIIPPGALPPRPTKRPKPTPTPPSEKPTKPATPPPKPPATPSALDEQWRNNFLQARLEAFINGDYPKPPIPWNVIKPWRLANKRGLHTFRKVEKFVHEIDLTGIGTYIIALCRKVWDMLSGRGELMSVRFTFAILGVGNPFYPEGFHEADRVTFPVRQPEMRTKEEIEREIRAIMEEIYYVNTELTPLFLEYYEVIKSVPIEKQPEQPS